MRIPDGIDRYYFPPEMREAQCRYTLHLDFAADDDDQARLLAEMYARGLNYLRMEVDFYTARISPYDQQNVYEQVFCLAAGPDPADICSDIAGHGGGHSGPGVSHVWADTQVPGRPATVGY